MSKVLAPEPSPLSRFPCVTLKLGKISRQQQRTFLFVPEREDELHGVLGNSQNRWARDSNVALFCPAATAVTALWHSHCSLVYFCFAARSENVLSQLTF